MTPIILSALASFTSFRSTDPRQAVQMDAGLLVNTYREPIRIRELNWNVLSTPNADSAANAGLIGWGSPVQALSAKISVAGRGITQDYVTLGNMGPSLTPSSREPFGGPGAETRYGLDQGVADRAGEPLGTYYRWIFPKPLDLAPGQAINAALLLDPAMLSSAYTDGTLTSLETTVRLSLLGHMGGIKVPAIRPVPFVSQYAFTPGGPQISDAGALSNPFLVPLEAQRLIMRRWRSGQSQVNDVTSPSEAGVSANVVNTQRITVMAPNNYAAVRDPIDLNQVICAARRSWDLRGLILRSNQDYFQIRLVDPLPADVATAAYRITASLVGSRMENL